MNDERKAKLLLQAVVMIWGLNVVMIKYTGAHFDSPIMMSAWRIGTAALMLAAFVWKSGGFIKLNIKEWGSIVGIAVSGIFLHQVTLAEGLQTTDASLGALILGLNPLVTLILAYLIFREPLNLRKIAGVLLGLAGVVIVVFGTSWVHGTEVTLGKGLWLVAIAMLVYVISGLFIKQATKTVPVLIVSAYSHIMGTALLAVTATGEQLASSQPFTLPTDWFVWAVLIFSGCVSTGLCSIWFNSGIHIIGASRASMYLSGTPIWGLVFSMIFLGESIYWVHIVGFATVFYAIFLGTAQPKTTLDISRSQPSSQA